MSAGVGFSSGLIDIAELQGAKETLIMQMKINWYVNREPLNIGYNFQALWLKCMCVCVCKHIFFWSLVLAMELEL